MPPTQEDSYSRQDPPQRNDSELNGRRILDQNCWHREWMERTENAYEWWYFDSVSDDGQWSLVVIFLLGSPFSPYTRACELSRNPDPLQYNGVFVALHRRGRLLHYQYSRYAPGQISGSAVEGDSPMALEFGPNSWRESAEPGGYAIALNEENANCRRMAARLSFSDFVPHGDAGGEPIHVLAEPGHNWLPVIVGGRAHCVIDLHSPAESRESERIDFRGSAYHDHNWGTLPFSSTIGQWLWARSDFAPGCAAVVYHTTPIRSDGNSKTILLTRAPGEPLSVYESGVKAAVKSTIRNGYGVSYPREIGVDYGLGSLRWKFGRRLESTPFYMRCETVATWRRSGETEGTTLSNGQGIGEMLRPRGMGAWLVSHAMRLRIHEPGL